jgi:hypothetical protein
MKQIYISIILFTVLIVGFFSSKTIAVDKGIEIMAASYALDTNQTVSVIMHDPQSLQKIYIEENNVPIEKALLKNSGTQNYSGNTMPIAPMPIPGSSSSSDKKSSDLFSFDTPEENNNNQNWGWVDNAVRSSDNYREITPSKTPSKSLFENYGQNSSFGGERQSFFDDTLYGSDKSDSFLDGYNMNNTPSKDSGATPYSSTMSW